MSQELMTLVEIVVQTVIFLLGGYAMVVRADQTTKTMRDELQSMKSEINKLATVITIQAVQTERLDNMSSRMNRIETTVEDLRRGAGWIQKRATLDGEYTKSD